MARGKRDEAYLTPEYEAAIETYADIFEAYDESLITAVFLYDCRKFDALFLEDSLSRVRSVAWSQTKHRLKTDNIPDDCQLP